MPRLLQQTSATSTTLEACQLLRGGTRAELSSALIPLARLGKIRRCANRTEALEHNWVECRSECEGAFGAICLGGTAKEQPRGGEIAIGQ